MNMLALTFDDGPDRRWTPLLLDILERFSARATFFVIAQRASALPHLIERILDEGHCIGLHCDEHVRHTDRDRAWLEADTERALERLASLGVSPALWRTPWGVTAPWTREIAHRWGLDVIHWSVDTHDWRGDDAATMFAAARGGLIADAVVLAHDGIGPGARRQTARETLALTEMVAGYAAWLGLELRSLA